MTQNLDFDLKENVALTPDSSDVLESWTPDASKGEVTIAENNLSAETWPNDNTAIRSYDAGMYVYTRPTTSEACNTNTTEGDITKSVGLGTQDCKDKGWVNVASMTPSSDPNYGTGVTDNVYNAHYLVGNYYNWGAATAGQAKDITTNGQNATQSVCPAGWQLPQAGRNDAGYPYNYDKTFTRFPSISYL